MAEYDAAKDAHDSYYAAIAAKKARGDGVMRPAPRPPAPRAPVSRYHIADALLAPDPAAQLSPRAAIVSERLPLNALNSLKERKAP